MNPRRSILRAALVAISLAGFTLLGALMEPLAGLLPQARPAQATQALDCPLPTNEGETWISRRWIDRGELRVECSHVAGFPALHLPTALKLGLVR